jgi:phosphocarrier protein FPr
VAALGAEQGHVVDVAASGPDAHRAVERLLDLARRGFGDLDAAPSERLAAAVPPPTTVAALPRTGAPLPASPGVAIGPVWQAPSLEPDDDPDDDHPGVERVDPAVDEARLRAALAGAADEVRRVRDHTAAAVGESAAGVFDAHLLLLDDPDLLGRALASITAGHGVVAAWRDAVTAVAATLANLPDAYQRARADDIRAVGAQVEAHLRGSRAPAAEVPPGSVLVARDLTPAQAATLDPARVVAVVLAGGSPTAHGAILVRALGIPAVVGAGADVLTVANGVTFAVDGTRGEVVVDPSPAVRAVYEERALAAARRRESARAAASVPAVTRDGVEIHVGANLASLDDARAAAHAGADLAGLVRTELLFLDRVAPPTIDEQADTYRALADALPGRRIVVRTLDVGGDKPLPYLPMPPETNPFLGVRGIRLSLQRPELLLDQLRAIVRVAHERPVDVMFPMVSTLAELLAARRLLADAVHAEGGGPPAELRVGIMVEVPAAALKAATFAPHVDFFSVGTNDLTQYALAAERGNDAVAALADPLDPGLLALVAAAARAGTPVAVCGELAADELATGLLIGLGVRELSVSPAAVAVVKQAVREVDTTEATAVAAAALTAPDAAAVRAML